MSKSNAAKKEPVILEDTTNAQNAVAPATVNTDEAGRKTTVDMSLEDFEAKGWKTTSSAIRGLWAEGYSRSAIAKFLNKRYQHVRNVLITPLKKG